MKIFIPFIIFSFIAVSSVNAGDDASGPIPCSIDLSKKYEIYQMTPKDKRWSESLVRNLKYKGTIVHFVRTTLTFKMKDMVVNGSVYQALEKPDYFYIVDGDVMLKIGSRWAYSPGVGGFSMHAPKDMKFIVCLNFQGGGVPFLSSTPVVKGKISWMGDNYKRF